MATGIYWDNEANQGVINEDGQIRTVDRVEYGRLAELKGQAGGSTQRFLAGAKNSLMNLGYGMAQLGPGLPGMADDLAAQQTQMNREYAPKYGQFGGAAAELGQFAPDLASGFIPGKWPVQLGIGAVEGAARNPQNQLMGAAGGAAFSTIGDWGGNMASRVWKTISGSGQRLRREGSERAVIEAGQAAGLQFSPGQISGRQGEMRLESQLRKTPAFAALDEQRFLANQSRLNDLAAQTLGLPAGATRITPEMRANVVDDVGKEFDNVALATDGAELDAESIINLEEDLTTAGAEVWNSFKRKFPDISEGGKMSGADFNQARNWLAKASRKTANIQNGAADEIQEMIGMFDETLELANPDQAAAIKAARKKWKALLVVESSMGGAQGQAAGNISPYGAYRSLVKYDKGGFGRGRTKGNEFYDAVRAMSMTGDVQPGHTVSARPQGIGGFLMDPINRRMYESYLEGGRVGKLATGFLEADPSQVVRSAGRGGGLAAFHGLFGDDQSANAP